MIKKETILSVFDKKLTLLQYLKEIKSAIEDSIVESFSCDQIDTTHVKFALNFADGTKYETDAIEVPTGPQGETGATPQIEVSVSAETLEPNESATANVTQGGTAEAPTIAIAFGIPKGEQGETGETKLYMHVISFNYGNQKITIYSSSSTPFTFSTLYSFIITGLGSLTPICAYGTYTSGGIHYYVNTAEAYQNKITFRGLQHNPTSNVSGDMAVDCYANSFTNDVVIDL